MSTSGRCKDLKGVEQLVNELIGVTNVRSQYSTLIMFKFFICRLVVCS